MSPRKWSVEETLPILYETLCLDRVNAKAHLLGKRKKENAALEHIKYAFINQKWVKDDDQRQALVDKMSNLVMLVSMGREVGVHLYRSCPSRVAFFILKTPVLQSTTFDLAIKEVRIASTRLRQETEDEQNIDTAIELAKLAGWQTHEVARALSEDEEDKQKRPSHIGWYHSFQYNLSFSLSRSGFDVFLEKLELAAQTFPDVTLPMILISLSGVRDQKEFEGMVDKLFDFYARHITSPRNVLKLRPEDTEDPTATLEVPWRPNGTARIAACQDGDGVKVFKWDYM